MVFEQCESSIESTAGGRGAKAAGGTFGRAVEPHQGSTAARRRSRKAGGGGFAGSGGRFQFRGGIENNRPSGGGRDGGKLGPKAQLNIQVSVPHMGRIEDAHMIVCHMIVYYFVDVEK